MYIKINDMHIYREYFSYFEKTIFILCEFRVFLQSCITGVNRTILLCFSKVPVQILRVALNLGLIFWVTFCSNSYTTTFDSKVYICNNLSSVKFIEIVSPLPLVGAQTKICGKY